MKLARHLFTLLIALHPRSFRANFGPEMLRTYDEAANDYSVRWMLGDACLSLVRQLAAAPFRSRQIPSEWQAAGLRSGTYPLIDSSRVTAGKLLSGALLSAALYELIRPG